MSDQDPVQVHSVRPGMRIIVAGFLAGVLGAILMGAAGSIYMAVTGGGWAVAMQAIAGTYYKSMAFVGGPGVLAIGVLTHLAVGGAFGALFGVLTVKAKSSGKLFLLGIPYGVAIWAFMSYVILPVFDSVMLPRVMMIGVFWFFLHWIYGAFTGLFTPGLRRAFVRAQAIEEAPPMKRVA